MTLGIDVLIKQLVGGLCAAKHRAPASPVSTGKETQENSYNSMQSVMNNVKHSLSQCKPVSHKGYPLSGRRGGHFRFQRTFRLHSHRLHPVTNKLSVCSFLTTPLGGASVCCSSTLSYLRPARASSRGRLYLFLGLPRPASFSEGRQTVAKFGSTRGVVGAAAKVLWWGAGCG
ncbi:hypothetical protein E2320_020516, partial [Naja naja]